MPVIVAVINTGIDPGHFVFEGHLAGFGWDYVTERPGGFDVTNGRDDDHDGFVDESYGHGTHVAGTVLAFDPAAHILPMRVLDADGNGSAFALARAIEDSVDAGASFINLSLSVTEPSLPVAIALHHAWKHGVAVFTSAGNLGKKKVLFPGNFSLSQFPVFARRISNDIPRGFDPVVTVSSVDDHDVKSSFASWGPEVDLVAPGEGIYSAFPGNRVAWWSGTSMACAVATGCASLLLSSGYTYSAPPVVDALVSTGHSVNWQNPAYWGMLGAGRINVWHANMELWHHSH
ncbi:MAG: S8 family serine peptidase [Myxococcales bacterium]|nr:S8 family serine peptidase [Myxococcales bacterium]